MSLSSKNKKIKKIQDQIRFKTLQQNTCIMGFQTISRQLKFQSNLKFDRILKVKFTQISFRYDRVSLLLI